MKKALTIIVALLLSITATYAGNGKSINSIISQHLKVPNELKEVNLNEKVNVQFKINTNGKATVMNVETSNKELKNYIINQFSKIDFNTVAEKQEKVYLIDINFRVL